MGWVGSTHRRRVLGLLSGSVALPSLVGCVENGPANPAMIVSNFTSSSVNVGFEVSRQNSGEEIINDEFSLSGDEDKLYSNPFSTEGEKLVKTTVNSQMQRSITFRGDPDDNSRTLSIRIKKDTIETDVGIN
jgi:hypothetical protein